MIYRKLRIAWSVGWGIACVLLIVLWGDSYWSGGEVITYGRGAAIQSIAVLVLARR
jgi:hypothetical protein